MFKFDGGVVGYWNDNHSEFKILSAISLKKNTSTTIYCKNFATIYQMEICKW